MTSRHAPSALTIAFLSLIFGIVGGGIGGYYVSRTQVQQAQTPGTVVAGSPAASAPASKLEVTTDQNAIVNAVKRVSPAVVKITGQREPRSWMELMSSGGVISGIGSGVIFEYEKRKLVLTNTHVIGDFTDLTVKLTDGRELKAQPLGRMTEEDLAVLEIINPPADLKSAPLGDSDKLQAGEWVIAVGNPFNFEHTVTVGVVSALGARDFGRETRKVIQTDAAINQGNSGGPLVDLAGNVIGINFRIFDPQGNPVATNVGIGFSIPINQAKEALYFLVHRGPFIGLAHVMPNSPGFAHYYQLGTDKGIVVLGIYEGGPADRAGLRAGDVIIAVDGKTVTQNDEMQKALFKHRIGDTVRLTVQRGGNQQEISVTAEKVPEDAFR
jgi:serine protease Do